MRELRFCLAAALLTAVAPMAAAPAAAARHGRQHPATAAADAAAPATQSLGGAGAWAAYAARDQTGRVCYLAGHPQRSAAAGIARREPMAMVTHRPAENIANVVSFVEGYPLKPGSEVTLDVDGRKFALFTKDDSAWARTSELDRTIVAALAKGRSIIVKGVPEKGRQTTDIYSLAGFDKALSLIDKACGIKREAAAAPVPPAHAATHRRHRPHKSKKSNPAKPQG